MTERIQVGDLVQIVRARICCPEHTGWGLIFRVVKIDDTGPHKLRCSYCGTPQSFGFVAWDENSPRAEVWRLRRIPPLSELESSKTDEPLKEPA